MRPDPDLKTEEERKISQESASLFGRFLDDLEIKNRLRHPTDQEKRRLLSILSNTWEFQSAFNEMTRQNFNDLAAKTGLAKETFEFSFINQLLGNLLICYESLIKLSLLFFLNEKSREKKRLTLGQLLGSLKVVSPTLVAWLDPMINRDLRNALAHGFFWLERDGLHFAKNSHLDGEERISYNDLRDEMRKASIIGRTFVHVMSEKVKQGLL